MNTTNELGNLDSNAINALFEQYQKDPESMDETFRHFFEGFELGVKQYEQLPQTKKTSISTNVDKEMSVLDLIESYRRRGHLFTKTNPVRTRRKYFPTLDIENFGLSSSDLNTKFEVGKEIGIGAATLQEIINHLEETYCKSVGVEYRYMCTKTDFPASCTSLRI